MFEITKKQINYITYLFRDTPIYEEWNKTSEKYPDERADWRDMILYDKIKNITSLQASSIIEDIQKENWDLLRATLMNL